MLRARSSASWALVLAMLTACAAWAEPSNTETALRQVIAQGGKEARVARYNLTQWLWRQGRHAEAVEMAREYLSAEPQGRFAEEARVVLCQARRDGNIVLPPTEPHSSQVKSGSGGTVSRPQIIHPVKPVYSAAARKAGVEGTVILAAVIDQEGCVQSVRLLKGIHPDLDQAAQDAVGQWIFLPARLEDEPVKVYYTLTVNFAVGHSREGKS